LPRVPTFAIASIRYVLPRHGRRLRKCHWPGYPLKPRPGEGERVIDLDLSISAMNNRPLK
jgi:hypothetical protein